MIEIPEAFACGTVEREGEAGADWLAALPAIVDGLLERWRCVLDGAVTHGGVGLIVPVRQPAEDGDRRAAVVKVSFPHPGNVAEPDAFEAWDGRGAVRLYARDDERFAMLLERAHTSTLVQIADHDEVARIAGRLNRRLAIPAPPGLPRLSERADEWDESLRRDSRAFTGAVPRAAVDAASATVRELGRQQPELVVHGDLHTRNILRAEREPWLAVDPKGYVGDPAYDGGMLLKAHMFELIREPDPGKAVLRLLEVFADAAELDDERVRRWANFQVVSSLFWGCRHGLRIARSAGESDRVGKLAGRLIPLLA
jgi:streptomycin 6-kinase